MASLGPCSFCSKCGFCLENHLNDYFDFCPSCGTEVNLEVASDDDVRSIIEYYFSRGYTHESIVKLLSKQHGIHIGK